MPTPPIPCRTVDPDLWFPVGTTGPALQQENRAKNLCFTCPIQAACLDTALRRGEDNGIWGGYSAAERRAILRHNPNFTLRSKDDRSRSALTNALASTTSSQAPVGVG